MHMTRAFLLTATALALTAPVAVAQDRADTILVLDASGSMWGQIDGINKIVIAREVVAGILDDFPADANLGLTLYGHRTRGECTDIETIIPPGTGNREAILAAVNTANPRGMTPMTDAIIAAAESLRATERAATVILVSDGIETCNPDPCAAARLLEETGVDFTAHVVGFDVAGEAEALAQMQCLAETTGGRFLTAENADELAAALETVVAAAPEPAPAPEPAVVPVTTTFRAILGQGGPEIDSPLVWELLGPDGAVVTTAQAPGLTADLTRGAYKVSVLRPEDEAFAQADVIVMSAAQTVTLVLPPPALTATLVAPASGQIGGTVPVGWEGPGEGNDYISVGPVGEDRWVSYITINGANPVDLPLPGTAGDYELRYQSGSDNAILARVPFAVTPVEVTITAPASAAVGAPVEVTWTGPANLNDYLGVAGPDGGYTTWVYTRDGNPARLTMPADPGTYEIVYFIGTDNTAVGRTPITVTESDAALTAPAAAGIGTTIEVGWTGPGNDNDFIAVGLPGEVYTAYTYVNRGNPVEITLPGTPGTYELRYMLGAGERALATVAITVEALATGLTAPASGMAGETVDVAWTGPGNDNDYIEVGRPGEGYVGYTYVNRGNPAPVTLPAQGGTYELRYILGSDLTVLAATTITVTDVTAQLVAPQTATAGGVVPVGWDGPGYDNDFLGIARVGEPGYLTYEYTNRGNPVDVAVPEEPGDYEIRYFLGLDESVLARVPLTVTAP